MSLLFTLDVPPPSRWCYFWGTSNFWKLPNEMITKLHKVSTNEGKSLTMTNLTNMECATLAVRSVIDVRYHL